MFASQVKQTVEIESVSVVIRKLSAVSLEKAAKTKTGEQIADAKGFGADMLKAVLDPAIQDARVEAAAEKAKEEAPGEKRFRDFDRMSVLRAGIESWDATYPEDHDEKKLAGKAIPVATGIDDLDEESAEALFRKIVELSVPTKEEEEEARGNPKVVSPPVGPRSGP